MIHYVDIKQCEEVMAGKSEVNKIVKKVADIAKESVPHASKGDIKKMTNEVKKTLTDMARKKS